ncbi:MAG: IS1595 family transposase [Alphaproteobacteria bacterium]|nr:IS1595 family transposase [Alphaproteobacteria bacterium]
MSHLSNPIFHDETKARKWLEARIWANGRMCPHCGVVDDSTELKGKAHRPGVYQCNACRKQFTVTVGTLFERSKIPLDKWLMATYLLCASKKGMSTRQFSRMLNVSVKSTWFMMHRIREAMRDGDLAPFGQGGGMVEVDETFIGRKKGKEVRHGYEHKMKVLSLVDRETGKARSIVVNDLKTKTVAPIVRANIAREAKLMTDEARHYVKVGREYADHQVVRHNIGEYGRGEAHTNTIEGFFSIFKRGMKGVYQHCGEKHLHRYLAEFDFRYTERKISDFERASLALMGIQGRRLTYRRADAR